MYRKNFSAKQSFGEVHAPVKALDRKSTLGKASVCKKNHLGLGEGGWEWRIWDSNP